MSEDPTPRDPGPRTGDHGLGPDLGLAQVVGQKSDSGLASFHASGQISDLKSQSQNNITRCQLKSKQ